VPLNILLRKSVWTLNSLQITSCKFKLLQNKLHNWKFAYSLHRLIEYNGFVCVLRGACKNSGFWYGGGQHISWHQSITQIWCLRTPPPPQLITSWILPLQHNCMSRNLWHIIKGYTPYFPSTEIARTTRACVLWKICVTNITDNSHPLLYFPFFFSSIHSFRVTFCYGAVPFVLTMLTPFWHAGTKSPFTWNIHISYLHNYHKHKPNFCIAPIFVSCSLNTILPNLFNDAFLTTWIKLSRSM
jgi:hypothetical protein